MNHHFTIKIELKWKPALYMVVANTFTSQLQRHYLTSDLLHTSLIRFFFHSPSPSLYHPPPLYLCMRVFVRMCVTTVCILATHICLYVCIYKCCIWVYEYVKIYIEKDKFWLYGVAYFDHQLPFIKPKEIKLPQCSKNIST